MNLMFSRPPLPGPHPQKPGRPSSVSPRDIALALDPRLVQSETNTSVPKMLSRQVSPGSGGLTASRESGSNPADGSARMPQPVDDDDTVSIKGPPPPSPLANVGGVHRPPAWAIALPVLLVAILGGAAFWWNASPSRPPEVAKTVAPVTVVPPPSVPAIGNAAPAESPLPPALAVTSDPGFVRPARIAPQSNPPAAAQPEFQIDTADERHILDHVSTVEPDGTAPKTVFPISARTRGFWCSISSRCATRARC